MERNNIIVLSITLVVSIVLIGGLLMPVISDATSTEKTFVNDGIYYMTDFSDVDSVSYTFDGTNWTIDGEPSGITASGDTTIIAGDGIIVRANGNIPGIASPKSITSLVVTESGFTIDYVKSDDTTATYTSSAEIYYCAVNSPTSHVLGQYNTPAYVTGSSDIVADGFSGVASGLGSIFLIEGNITDGITVTAQREGVTVSDVVCDYEEVEGYDDLYKINKITFTTTYSDTVRAQEYTSYVIPAEVTAERSQHLNTGEIAILGAIPVLVIVSLVIVAAMAIKGRE